MIKKHDNLVAKHSSKEERKMKRKVISWILAVAMVFTLMPMTSALINSPPDPEGGLTFEYIEDPSGAFGYLDIRAFWEGLAGGIAFNLGFDPDKVQLCSSTGANLLPAQARNAYVPASTTVPVYDWPTTIDD